MATKTADKDKSADSKSEGQDGPLLDMSDQAVKRMIKLAKQRGYVTYDELNQVLPSEEVSSEQIEDTMSMLSEMGINVVEQEEVDEVTDLATTEETKAVTKTTKSTETVDRTDDPVRMYLREMGSVELLSREGEIAIAKRIEAGREAMIAGLCESPLTFQAIIIWRDELNEGRILLRDIIDLDATYAGPDAKAVPSVEGEGEGEGEEGEAAEDGEASENEEAQNEEASEEPDEGGETSGEGEDDLDDDDQENSLSLAAMEAELKPKVVETFDSIASNYKKLRRLQDQLVENALKSKTLSPSQERRYKKLRTDIVEDVKQLSLNNHRI